MSRAVASVRLAAWVLPIVALTSCVSRAQNGVEPIAAGGGHDVELSADVQMAAAQVARGATFASILRDHGVITEDVASATSSASSVFDLRKVRAAQAYRIEVRPGGALRAFDYEIDGDRLLRIRRDTAGLSAAVALIAKTREVAIVRGTIDRARPSLFAAVDGAGGSIDLSLALADIFGGDIDFNTELQPGDRFELLVEKQYRAEGKAFAGYGPILAAEFDNGGRRIRAFRYAAEDGEPRYYDERGVSMRRFFLKSPLKFEPVVTSAFSLSRFHPILQEYRAHLGVDYRAPAGAPVVAVADGVVLQAAMSGGSGRLVHLRHGNGYETEYLHLSSIAVRPGMRVRQGDVVGRVGSSGLATGPHLDYRVKRNGLFINPLAAHRAMPPSEPIPGALMTAFHDACEHAFSQLGVWADTPAAAPARDAHQP